jgi:tetratricopeptide (TPR) repeat protein/predicted Ser/Thr protein kinase
MSLVGRLVGHYRILDALGEGGMGEVFLAEDTRLRRPVALKMLGSRTRQEAASCERLAREARVASLLNHPGIAVVYETGTLEVDDERRAYIAMEYVAGESLKQRLQRGPLEAEEVLELVLQLTDALEEAHAHGVVHRDIKPANVVLDGRRRAKLLDFGLASYTPTGDGDDTWSGPEAVLPPGALAGTLAYMAPEQARGRRVDARADVFGLGALLYALLAGRPPFAGESAVDVLDSLLNDPPPPIEHRTGAPPLARALEAIARRMLAKDPGARPTGMPQVREALRSAAGGGDPNESGLPPTAAVLAFANLTRRPEDDWIATALAESVAAGLRQIPGLSVVSRERLEDARRRLDLPDAAPAEALASRLAPELRARWMVLGDFQRVGDAIRISARVSDAGASNAAHARIDGTLSGIFAAQDRLVAELSRGLRVQLGDPALAGGDETRVVEAYEAFTRGVVNLRAETRESLDRAIAFFEQALALDPSYFEAHVRLGVALDLKASFLGGQELHRRAIASIRRALELRPEDAVAWRELASCQLSIGGLDEQALVSAQRSVELDPQSAATHAILARVRFIGFARFEEAADDYTRALELNPEAGWYALQLSMCAALLGQLERAESAARKALVLQEGFLSGRQGLALVGAFVRLGQVAALGGRPLDAVELYRREEEFVRRVGHALAERILIEIRYRMGSALVAAGRREEAQRELRAAVELHEARLRLGADDPFTRYYAACARALLGEVELAIGDLERALEQRRAYVLRRARAEPDLAALRGHPRLAGLEAAS